MKKIKKYNNGLTLVYQNVPTVRSVAFGIFVSVGSINESPKTNGISHFIEHMCFKGTKKRSAFDIVKEIDNIGAQINAYTSKTNTCYYTVCVDENAEQCAEILSDIYFNSVFPEDEIEREKGVVLEEISMTADTVDDLCIERANSAFYKGHPLARPILGTKKTVQSFTQADLFEFVDKHYTADNTVISVVGNIAFEKVESILNELFIPQFGSNKAEVNKISVAKTNSTFTKRCKRTEQSHLVFMFPGISYTDELEGAIKVFNTSFGYGMSSRLFQNIRERQGLAYSVYSYPSFYKNEGYCLIYVGTNVSNVKNVTEAIRKEIDDVIKNGITAEEFERGKAQIKSSFVFGQESTANLMMLYGKYALMTGKLVDIDEKVAKFDKISKEDIDKVITKIFDFSKVTASYVGPKCDVDILKLIQGQ